MAKSVAQDVLDGFQINLNGWKVRQFRDFLQALQSNDFDTVADLVSGVVIVWPFEGRPEDPESFLDLEFVELGRLLRAINGAMTASFSQGN